MIQVETLNNNEFQVTIQENNSQSTHTVHLNDDLHQQAGSQHVIEFHGTSRYLVCTHCGRRFEMDETFFNQLPPLCRKCSGVLKPDFVFFGEPIPEPANILAFEEAEIADVFLVIGTTGEIYPASLVPGDARDNQAKIIEINPEPSKYTDSITDLFLQGNATDIMKNLLALMNL